MDYPTSNDLALSSLTGKHCRVINVFAGEDVCREKSATEKMKEYIATMNEVNQSHEQFYKIYSYYYRNDNYHLNSIHCKHC